MTRGYASGTLISGPPEGGSLIWYLRSKIKENGLKIEGGSLIRTLVSGPSRGLFGRFWTRVTYLGGYDGFQLDMRKGKTLRDIKPFFFSDWGMGKGFRKY